MDLVKADSVTSPIPVAPVEAQAAARENSGNNPGDIPNLVVFRSGADVEDLFMNQFPWRLERASNGVSDIPHMDQRAPRASVACHGDFLCRPSKAGQIIEDEVKTHTRRGAISRSIAQKHW